MAILAACGAPAAPAPTAAPPIYTARSVGARLAALWRGNELALIGAGFLLLIIIGAIIVPMISPYSPTQPMIRERLFTPSAAHPFSTDELGRDLLTRILYGARPILIIGTLIGVVAAYRGGLTDEVLMRLMDIALSLPSILLAILIVASLGAGLINLILAIAFSMMPLFARLARSIVLVIMGQDYILAARALGLPDSVIVRSHVLPNMLAPVLVQATAMLATAFATSGSALPCGRSAAAPC